MKIKASPEDFKVEEISKIPERAQGEYHYFRLTKRNYDWFKVAKKLAAFFHVKQKDIGLAGIKDKYAVTTQTISIRTDKPFLAEKFKNEDIQIEHVHRGKEPIHRGNLKGNRFTIVVRDLKSPLQLQNWMINYFDDQRFSTSNVDIGLYLLKKEYKEACALIDDQRVHDVLKERPTDCIAALKALPYDLLVFYAHAVQSMLWNLIVSSQFEGKKIETVLGALNVPDERPADCSVDLIGFDSEETEEVKAVLESFGLTRRSFVNRQLPALTCEGAERDMVKEVKDLSISELKDGVCTVSFTLEKGCYATMVLKQLADA